MFSITKQKCSWSNVAAVASIVTLVSVVHLFLYPVVPSLDYFTQFKKSCIPMNISNSNELENYKSTGGSQKNATDIISTEGSERNLGTNTMPTIDPDVKFPVDLHNAVVYRGAPWKAAVGRWLAGCDSNTSAVKVVEQISGKSCRDDCNGQGICNRELGQCRCFHGFTGWSTFMLLTSTVILET